MKKKIQSFEPKSPEVTSYPVKLQSTENSWRHKRKLSVDVKTALKEEALLHASGINLRVVDRSEQIKRSYCSLLNDHTYVKKTKSISHRLEQYVNQALEGVCDTNTKKKTDEQVPEHLKGTQLYKYLITPVETRQRRGESFGHFVMSEREQGHLPKVGVGVETKGAAKRLRITRVDKDKPKPPVVPVQPSFQNFQTQIPTPSPSPHNLHHFNHQLDVYNNINFNSNHFDTNIELVTRTVFEEPFAIQPLVLEPQVIDIDENPQLVPICLMKNEAEWTFFDSQSYETWWQNLPSCPHQPDGMFGLYPPAFH